MASHPSSSRRNQRQKVKARYAKAREEAQLMDLIPTTPEGAVRDERVDPATQADPPDPGLVGRAVRRGWAVPDEKKPVIVDELVKIVESENPLDPNVKISAARTLRMVDRDQWERDNPEVAGRAKGGTNVSQTNGQVVVTGRGVLEAVLGVEPTPAQKRLADLEAAEKEVAGGQREQVRGSEQPDAADDADGQVRPGANPAG